MLCLSVQFVCKDRLPAKLRILGQKQRALRPLVIRTDIAILLREQKRALCLRIGHQIEICRLGRLGQPFARIVFRRFLPSEWKVERAKGFRTDRQRIQKLIVQWDRLFLRRTIFAGDIQRVPIMPTAIEIFVPHETVLLHPFQPFEHARRQDHVHIGQGMYLSPQISHVFHAEPCKQILEIHLMYDALDIRQTDLEGVMRLFFACVEPCGELFGNQPFAVKFFDVDYIIDCGQRILTHRCV